MSKQHQERKEEYYLKVYRALFLCKGSENMSAWTLETAQMHLNAWLQAELSVTTGQAYSMGTRSLTRANLSEIRKQIEFWKNEVNKLSNKGSKKGTNRIYRAVPRDL